LIWIGFPRATPQFYETQSILAGLRETAGGKDRFYGLIEQLSVWIGHGQWFARQQEAARRKPAEPLKAYCAHELDRWRRRLIHKGRHIATMQASSRHCVRIKAKRFRYMLEELMRFVPGRDQDKLRRMHKPAKRLQQVLGDLRDLERLARLGTPSRLPERDEQRDRRPPGYRRQVKKLLAAAVTAHRTLKQIGMR